MTISQKIENKEKEQREIFQFASLELNTKVNAHLKIIERMERELAAYKNQFKQAQEKFSQIGENFASNDEIWRAISWLRDATRKYNQITDSNQSDLDMEDHRLVESEKTFSYLKQVADILNDFRNQEG